MKKSYFGLFFVFFLIILCLTMASCEKDPKQAIKGSLDSTVAHSLEESTEPDETEALEKTPLIPEEGYIFSFESNGDGTCKVVGLLVDYDAKDLSLEIPEFSPAGDRVVSYEVGRSVQWWQDFKYPHVPYLITKADFDECIGTPLKKALDEGKISEFKYYALLTEFHLQDLSTVENEKAKEQMKQQYPIVSVTPIYAMTAHADSGQHTVSNDLTEYANFTEQDCFEVTQNIWELCREANLPCKLTYVRNSDAITAVSFPEGIKTISYYSFAGVTGFAFVKLPDGLTEIGISAFERSGVQHILIPESVTLIENHALYTEELKSIYYCGTAQEWAKLGYEDRDSEAVVYCYSADPPTASGAYWRYVDGQPVPW